MKKLFALLSFVLMLVSCGGGEKLINRPSHGLRNTTTLEIDKILLTDTATVFYIDAFFRPKNWIRIAGDTYLRAGGEKFYITGAEGIKIDDNHYMPESGEDSFMLFFPPLPKGTKTIDFIEGDCDSCFKIWDIDLTGRNRYKADIPANMLNHKQDKNAPLPDVELRQGVTTLKLQLGGLRDGYVLGEEPVIIINDFFLGKQRVIKPVATDVNTVSGVEPEKDKIRDSYTFEFSQNGTATGWISFDRFFINMILAPGETAELYIDMGAWSSAKARYNPDKNIKYVGFAGKFAALNTEMAELGFYNWEGVYGEDEDTYEYNPVILDMTPSEWAAFRKEGQDKIISNIDKNKGVSSAYREFLTLSANVQYGEILSRVSMYFIGTYTQKNSVEYDVAREKFKDLRFDDELAMSLKDLNFDNTKYLYVSSYMRVAKSIIELDWPDTRLNDFLGTDTGLLQDMKKIKEVMPKAEGLNPLTDADKNALESVSIPLFREAFYTTRDEAQARYNKALAKAGYTIKDTPKVAPDKIIEAIIAEYNGKPVFIDFWATWCMPCIAAMSTIKPFKPEMKEHGVEILYISGETSPKANWMEMLPDIGEKHYYLTSEQWKAVCDKYGIQGIPNYMIVDKSGKITFQTAGFPGNNKLREEFGKVW